MVITPIDSFVGAMRRIIRRSIPNPPTPDEFEHDRDCQEAVEAFAKMSRIKYHMGQPYIDNSETEEERCAALLKRVMAD